MHFLDQCKLEIHNSFSVSEDNDAKNDNTKICCLKYNYLGASFNYQPEVLFETCETRCYLHRIKNL
jgi:hypothetical protein